VPSEHAADGAADQVLGIDLVDVVLLDERQDLVEGLEGEGLVGPAGFRGVGSRSDRREIARCGEGGCNRHGQEKAGVATSQGVPPNAGERSEYTTLFADCRGKRSLGTFFDISRSAKRL
jgi:hypothetical protein